jgi:hypothetical protein
LASKSYRNKFVFGLPILGCLAIGEGYQSLTFMFSCQ